MELETCGNCGAPIGRLESAMVWNDTIVCATCHERIRQVNAPQMPVPLQYGSPVYPAQQPIIIHHVSRPSNGVAALLSFLIPGVGQIYLGRVGEGIMWMFLTIAGYFLFCIPGFIFHLLSIILAATEEPRV